jgi:stearoyl-CoA desaturase (Delta-9 desaturase)
MHCGFSIVAGVEDSLHRKKLHPPARGISDKGKHPWAKLANSAGPPEGVAEKIMHRYALRETYSHNLGERVRKLAVTIVRSIDADYFPDGAEATRSGEDRFEFRRALPFIFLHLGCLGVIWTGWSWTSVAVAAALYFIRMFAITAFYHRYFSHRTFHTSRLVQFLFAAWGNTAVQRGALWWASVHRHHHRHSDHEEDVHSPGLRGFWWSHIGWMTSSNNFPTNYGAVRDLAKYPELVFLNRFDMIVPALFAGALLGAGAVLHRFAPGLGVTGPQLLVWGFFISTIFLLHGTLFINSLAHVMGRRRFRTDDDSRNSLLLALITLGEGWHNNHHRFMAAARQGFYWWEFDPTYYTLKLLSWTGLIWNLRPVPQSIYEEARRGRGPDERDIGKAAVSP